MQFHNKIEKQNALFSVGLFSTIKINKKRSKIKQNNHTPTPFLKQNKNTRCCMYTTSLEIGKKKIL